MDARRHVKFSAATIKQIINRYRETTNHNVIPTAVDVYDDCVLVALNRKPPDGLLDVLNRELPLAQNVRVGPVDDDNACVMFLTKSKFRNRALRFVEQTGNNVAHKIPQSARRFLSVFVVGLCLVLLALYILYQSGATVYNDFLRPL